MIFNEINIVEVEIKAKNLVVMYECEDKLIQQVSNICKTGFYRASNLAAIRKSLDLKTTAVAFTISSLDYCNALLYMVSLNITSIKCSKISQQLDK